MAGWRKIHKGWDRRAIQETQDGDGCESMGRIQRVVGGTGGKKEGQTKVFSVGTHRPGCEKPRWKQGIPFLQGTEKEHCKARKRTCRIERRHTSP
eukprot:scaffold310_cov335-Pavlova_lutheri.AAC.65